MMRKDGTLQQTCLVRCDLCGNWHARCRSDAKYCSAKHRQRAYRLRKRVRDQAAAEAASLLSREARRPAARPSGAGKKKTAAAVSG